MGAFDILLEGKGVTLVTMIAALALSQLLYELIRRKRSTISEKDKFFQALDKKFELSLVKDRSDILVLKESICREEEVTYSLAPLLEDYLKYITFVKKAKHTDIQKKYDFVKKILDEETKEKPFADMPEEERRILKSLKDAVDHKDDQAVNFNLEELSAMISTRNRIYSRANRLNRWTVPLAIVSLFTTVIFGIMSITQKIDYEKLAKIVSQQQPKQLTEQRK